MLDDREQLAGDVRIAFMQMVDQYSRYSMSLRRQQWEIIWEALKSAKPEEREPGASPRLLLDQVRREWYRLTGYSQLKADIDFYLDSSRRPQRESE